MWAQMITTRLKTGHEGDLPRLIEQLQAIEQPGSGLVRSTAMQDQKDPSKVYMFVVFESEEAARARENDPRRQEGLQAARATMAEIFDGAPEFLDLTVVGSSRPRPECGSAAHVYLPLCAGGTRQSTTAEKASRSLDREAPRRDRYRRATGPKPPQEDPSVRSFAVLHHERGGNDDETPGSKVTTEGSLRPAHRAVDRRSSSEYITRAPNVQRTAITGSAERHVCARSYPWHRATGNRAEALLDVHRGHRWRGSHGTFASIAGQPFTGRWSRSGRCHCQRPDSTSSW